MGNDIGNEVNELFLQTTRDKTLRVVQELEIGALLEVDRICRKYNIEYSLGGGTCLGQVRHGGFIPWDDDIDVDLTLDNYKKFIEVAPKELEGTDYYLLARETDPNYKRSHSRIAVKDTIMNFRWNVRYHVDRGVFIDVFAWNYLPNNRILRKIVSTMLYYIRCTIKFQDCKAMDSTLTAKGRSLTFRLSKMFPYKMLQKVEYALNHCCKGRTKWIMEDVTVKGNFGGYPSEGIDEYKDVEFEGHTVRSKKNTDTFLTTLYSEKYNEWLPPEKRLSVHSWYQMDLGHFAEDRGLPEDYRECFTNAFTVEKLKLMKELSYDMADRVAEICDKYGLKYYLMGLDAILKAMDAPEIAELWHEPLKIALPLDDYIKFREVCPSELGTRYEFVDFVTDPNYNLTHGRIRLNYTIMKEVFLPAYVESKINMGFYIRIVPLADTSDNAEERSRQRTKLARERKKITLQWFRGFKRSKNMKERIKRLILTFTNTRTLVNRYIREVHRYKNTNYYIDASGSQLYRITAEKDVFGEGRMEEWGGRTYRFPDKLEELIEEKFSRYVLSEEEGKRVVRRYNKQGRCREVFTTDLTTEELSNIRHRYNNCLLNYYDLPECQLTVLRYDEKQDRLLTNDEIMGPKKQVMTE